MEAAGKPLILHLLERVSRCKLLDSVWLATSTEKSDDILAKAVEKSGFNVYRGSLNNVLSRYWHLAKQEKSDAIVRLTGDCPLHDPGVIHLVVEHFMKNKNKFDYVSNVLPSTYPDGLDTEVFTFSALDNAYNCGTSPGDLEHVVLHIRRMSVETGREGNFFGLADFSHLRWTLDEPEDYDFIKQVYYDLYPIKKDFGWLDVLAWQTEDPKRLQINNMHIKAMNRNQKIWSRD